MQIPELKDRTAIEFFEALSSEGLPLDDSYYILANHSERAITALGIQENIYHSIRKFVYLDNNSNLVTINGFSSHDGKEFCDKQQLAIGVK